MDAAAVATVTGAVDYATIVTGISTIAAAIVLVIIAWKGASMLLGMVKRG